MRTDANLSRLVDECVLCWLATSSATGQPSVSPKEIFSLFDDDTIVIANIASPNSAHNIRENPKACVSFVNVFTQKGLQIKGAASELRDGDDDFSEIKKQLSELSQGLFPFQSVFRIKIEEVREILAPRYRLYPETTEQDQISSAMISYGVQRRVDPGCGSPIDRSEVCPDADGTMPREPSGPSRFVPTLRPLSLDDIDALFEIHQDERAIEMAAVFAKNRDEFNENWARNIADEGSSTMGILIEGKLVGHISSFRMDGFDSVGYWIARDHWGRGIATSALRMMLERIRVRPLHARVARQNAGSIRVLEKCGFEVVEYRVSPDDGVYPVCEEALCVLTR